MGKNDAFWWSRTSTKIQKCRGGSSKIEFFPNLRKFVFLETYIIWKLGYAPTQKSSFHPVCRGDMHEWDLGLLQKMRSWLSWSGPFTKNVGHSLGKSGHRQILSNRVSGYRVDLSWLHNSHCLKIFIAGKQNCSNYWPTFYIRLYKLYSYFNITSL